MFESAKGGGPRPGLDPSLAGMPVGELVGELRRKMADVSSKVEADAPVADTPDSVLPIPGPLGDLLPHGGLAAGTVVACPRGAITSAILAAATGSGRRDAAVIGERFDVRRPSLIDVWEMGGDLERIALIETRGADPAQVVSVVVDGVSVVVLGIPALRLAPTQVETLRARVRNKNAILLVNGGSWARLPHMTIGCRLRGNGGIGRGTGRLARLEMDVHVVAGQHVREGRLVLSGAGGGRTSWKSATSASADRLRLAETG